MAVFTAQPPHTFTALWTLRHTCRDARAQKCTRTRDTHKSYTAPRTGKHTQKHTSYTQGLIRRCNATARVYTFRNFCTHRRHAQKSHCNIQEHTFRDTHVHTETHSNGHGNQLTQISTLRNTCIYTETQPSMQCFTQVHTFRNTCVHAEMPKLTLQDTQVHTHRNTHIRRHNQMYPLPLRCTCSETHTYT